jgi:SulP family sulfate permease
MKDEGLDPRDPTWRYHFAIREPGGRVRRCDPIEWQIWRQANYNMSVLLKAFRWANKCGAFISFEGFSANPDRPNEFWNCTATAHFGPHDGAVWFSKFESESKAVESLSAGVVALVLLSYRFVPRFPGALLAVVGAVVASAAFHFSGHGIQVVGPVAGGPPHLSVPPLNWRLVRDLLPVAGSCFVMIVAQSSVTARAYAAKHYQALDDNRDLLGISAANAAAALSGTFVVNGSPTQTAMVETSGGSSQMARLSTALVVMLVLLFLTGPLQFLPVCVLGAIVLTIAVRLVDLRGLRDLRRKSPHEWILALGTAAFVVLFGVEDGILLALVLSLLQHVRHSYHPPVALKTQTAEGHWQMSPVEPGQMAAPGLLVFWFGSDLFYANVDRFATQARKLATKSPSPVRWFVVDAGAITRVDYTAGATLKELDNDLERHGVALVFAHVSESLKVDLDRQGLTEVIGPNRQFETLRECLAAYQA